MLILLLVKYFNILAIENNYYNKKEQFIYSHQLPNNKIIKNCEKILIKQKKQICILYELQKAINIKVT